MIFKILISLFFTILTLNSVQSNEVEENSSNDFVVKGYNCYQELLERLR